MNVPPKEVRRVDLPDDRFPFTLEALNPETREVVWSQTIERPLPGERILVNIPALRKQLGYPVLIRATYPDGTTDEQGPPEETIQ